ncbi:MAG: hypothetical protein KDI32_00895 [Pseudomonadales bacterium]|nr:hypothetical protein [Pseudomonadales bacterium]
MALAALAIVACSQSDSIPPLPVKVVREVLVFPAEVELVAGTSRQLSAQLNDANGEPVGGAKLAFATEQTELLDLSIRGRVRSRGPVGTGTVVVESGTATARVPVVVVPGKPARLRRLGAEAAAAAQPPLAAGALAVVVTDNFGNPVPRCEVVFRFRQQNSAPQTIRTDARGIATLASVGQGAQPVDVDVQVVAAPRVRTSYRALPAPPAASPAVK